jgi:hypothetical protein
LPRRDFVRIPVNRKGVCAMKLVPPLSLRFLVFGILVIVSARVCDGKERSDEDQLLAAWEQRAKGVKIVDCEFTRWEYAPNFGGVDAAGNPICNAIASGRMSFDVRGPWRFEVEQVKLRDHSTGRYKTADRGGEHWVFDGQSFWELDAKRKTIQQHPRDAAFLGIGMDAMFSPFWLALHGGKAAKIRRDFAVRVAADPRANFNEIWIELAPRSAKARAVYSQLFVIVQKPDLHPLALRMIAANGVDYTTFEFRKVKLNDVFAPAITAPTAPAGWDVLLSDKSAAEPVSVAKEPETPEVEKALPSSVEGVRKQRVRLLRRLIRRRS